jgi:hypothetical protein
MNTPIYGLTAEFTEPAQIVTAVERVREAGYRSIDCYTPFPVHGLAEAMDFDDIRVPWMIFIAGMLGTCAGYFLEWSVNAPIVEQVLRKLPLDVISRQYSYPLNIGGKPFHSWPTFIPVCYETTILFAALCAFVGMLALNGLPRPHHPIFNARNFDRASQDRFFLCIEAVDPKFDYENTWALLQSLGPEAVAEVER